MTPDTCRYCATPFDEYGKPIREARRLLLDEAELCFACGSRVVRAADVARHCACPRCAEREFQTRLVARKSAL